MKWLATPWASAALMASLHRLAEPPQAPRSARVQPQVRRKSRHRNQQPRRQPKDTSRIASSPQRSRTTGCDGPQVMASTGATLSKTARIPAKAGISPALGPCGGHRTGESLVSITKAAGKRMLRAGLPPYSQPLRLPRKVAASLRVTARSKANLVDVSFLLDVHGHDVTHIAHESSADRTALADLGLDSGDATDRSFEVELVDKLLGHIARRRCFCPTASSARVCRSVSGSPGNCE